MGREEKIYIRKCKGERRAEGLGDLKGREEKKD